jgi:hypothetical protein
MSRLIRLLSARLRASLLAAVSADEAAVPTACASQAVGTTPHARRLAAMHLIARSLLNDGYELPAVTSIMLTAFTGDLSGDIDHQLQVVLGADVHQ